MAIKGRRKKEMDSRAKFQLPPNHLFIAPTKAESAHLKKLVINSIHNPFNDDDLECTNYFEVLEGKAIIILQSKCTDGSGSNDILEGIVGTWSPYQKVILDTDIRTFDRDSFLEAMHRAIQVEKERKETFTFEDALITAEDFISKNIPPKNVILKPWLTEQSINNISGWRGTGKTWFAGSVADAVTKGESFGPWATPMPVPVCYLDGELPSADVQERFRIVGSLSNARRKAPLYIYSDSYANSLGLQRANLSDQEWRETFQEFLLKQGVKILVLDNISSLAPGIDENLKKDWDPINQWFSGLRFSGISTIPIFHVGKKGDQRGTSAHEDNVDTSMILSSPPGYSPEQGVRFVLKFKKTRVRNADLHMVSDYEFSFSEVNGRPKWIWKPVKGRTQIDILKLIDAGMKQSEIAKKLRIDKSYVSRIRADAIKKGLLTQKGKLTPQGLHLVNPADLDEEF
jgi:hypothetical protein